MLGRDCDDVDGGARADLCTRDATGFGCAGSTTTPAGVLSFDARVRGPAWHGVPGEVLNSEGTLTVVATQHSQLTPAEDEGEGEAPRVANRRAKPASSSRAATASNTPSLFEVPIPCCDSRTACGESLVSRCGRTSSSTSLRSAKHERQGQRGRSIDGRGRAAENVATATATSAGGDGATGLRAWS